MVMSHMMLVSRVLNGLLNSEETGAQDESTYHGDGHRV
jgi:hypothetical protein